MNDRKTALIVLTSILGLFIYHRWLPIIAAILFTVFLLETVFSFIKVKKLSLVVSFISFVLFIFGLMEFGIYIGKHFDELFNLKLDQLKPLFNYLKIPIPTDFDLNYILKLSLAYIKSNLNILSAVGSNSLQILIGLIFGVLFFCYEIKNNFIENNSWGRFIEGLTYYLSVLFKSFQTIMSLQVIVAILNTISLGILSLVIAKIVTGEFLPYWYILLPLVALFSLIPVIGNIIINLLVFVIAINVSVVFTVISIVYFFIIHKLELIAIAKLLGKKSDIPFLFVALSMLIGELLFNSMLGVLFGITLLLATKESMSKE